jgi:lysophospholipase L1-like esterase
MLDEYRDMTRAVCEDMGVDYTDLRQALRDGKPFLWPLNKWSVTLDGEHPSNLGARVLAEEFASAVTTWLNSY